jgi:hypothetical protein
MAMKFYSRHRYANYFLPVYCLILAFACTKPQIKFQSVYNSDNSTNVVEVDTFAVRLSTVFLDSFPTSGTKSQLWGRYNDPFFGKITSQSYSDIGVPSPLPTLNNFSIYDSIRLITRINKSFYGDTTQVQRFMVSQLTSVMDYPNLQYAFYNNNSIPYDPTILGSTDVQINPTAGLTSQRRGDSVYIPLPNSLGTELFGLLYRQSDTVKTAATFRGFFKGLTVYPDTTKPGAIYGFNDTMKIRIYYHVPGVVVQNVTTDFQVVNMSTQFNHITYDRSATQIASISETNIELKSPSTGNMAFFQPMSSLYVKLLFPTISDLLAYQDYLAIMRAVLIIKPVHGTYSPIFGLPPAINLATTDDGNRIGTQLNSGSGNLNIDYLYGTNTSYSYDITGYMQAAIKRGAQNNAKEGLILNVPTAAYNTTFNRAVLGDSFSPQVSDQVTLQIYYASYY